MGKSKLFMFYSRVLGRRNPDILSFAKLRAYRYPFEGRLSSSSNTDHMYFLTPRDIGAVHFMSIASFVRRYFAALAGGDVSSYYLIDY